MGRDLAVAAGLFFLAGLLFLLPAGFLHDCRLRLYSLWSQSVRTAQELQDKPPEYTAVTPPDERLRELTRQIEQKDAEIAGLRRQLRGYGELRTTFPLLQVTPARLLGVGGSREAPEVYLSVGTEDGVRPEHLLAQGSAFAGLIVNADKASSLALLATHPGCVIGGRSAASRELCSVRGQGGGRALAVFYTARANVAAGEKILTSGLTGKAPEGLLIGMLEDYPRPGKEPGTLEAPLKLEAGLNNLEEVLILGVDDKRSPLRVPSAPLPGQTPPATRSSAPATPGTPSTPSTPTTPDAPRDAPPAAPDRPTDPDAGGSPALGYAAPARPPALADAPNLLLQPDCASGRDSICAG